jgi:hypothetical protein
MLAIIVVVACRVLLGVEERDADVGGRSDGSNVSDGGARRRSLSGEVDQLNEEDTILVQVSLQGGDVLNGLTGRNREGSRGLDVEHLVGSSVVEDSNASLNGLRSTSTEQGGVDAGDNLTTLTDVPFRAILRVVAERNDSGGNHTWLSRWGKVGLNDSKRGLFLLILATAVALRLLAAST